MAGTHIIRTPDQRLRVFVSSTLAELAPERAAVQAAIEQLHLVPVMFELGARPYPPRELYRAYVDQSQIFVGIYWQSYGWVAPGEDLSGLEDEYHRAEGYPRLLYIKEPAPDREGALARFLSDIKRDDRTSYKRFGSEVELAELVARDLAVLLSERFEAKDPDPTPQPSATTRRLTTPIPLPLTTMVGRQDSVEVLTHLASEGPRLLTLTGPGGVGKTRLAVEVASQLDAALADGAAFVPLAAIDDPQLVVPAIASHLGVRLDGGQSAFDALVDHLDSRQAALIVDNLEQVIDAAPDLVALLERLPDLRMVATSRAPLRVAGEQVWPLEPLGVPDGAALDQVAAAPAVELFVQRARAADPSFALDASNVEAVAELARRLDGLPLAIELAAARVRLLPPSAILERLGSGLELLAGGADRPERHRTIAATIDWSVKLLPDAARTLFARLSVFSGGATLDAIERICDVEGRGGLHGDVEALLDHGLVRLLDGNGGTPRVAMLETVRAEAAARLAQRGETELLRRRHLDGFAGLADLAQPYLCGPDQVRWLARMDPERANLRAAATTAFEFGEVAVVLEMAWDLYIYYQLRGAYHEPAAWVARVAEAPDGLDRRQRAVVTTATSIGALSQGDADVEVARSALRDALTIFEEEGATFEAAVAHLHLGIAALATSSWDQASEQEQLAAQRFAAVGHDWGIGTSENLHGVARWLAGDLDAARSAHERALRSGRRIANETIVAQALTMLAALALDRAETDLAVDLLTEAAPLAETARDAIGASGCLEVLAAAAIQHDDVASARLALDVAAATRRRVASPLNVVLRHRVDHLRQVVRERSGDGASLEVRRPTGEAPPDVFEVLRRLADRLGERSDPEPTDEPSLLGEAADRRVSSRRAGRGRPGGPS